MHAQVNSAHKADVRPNTCQLMVSLKHSEMQGIDLTPGRVPWCMRRAKFQYSLTSSQDEHNGLGSAILTE